mmetsp:Transcript_54776/g.132997  ORF Transcript_54776/g.132997 Transcript_54776/m.132997 type:complete len:568 (-) Transcript_54776:2298-4001(-)
MIRDGMSSSSLSMDSTVLSSNDPRPNNDQELAAMQHLSIHHNENDDTDLPAAVEGSGEDTEKPCEASIEGGKSQGSRSYDESQTSSIRTRRTSFRRTVQRQRFGGKRNTLKEVIQAAERQSSRDYHEHAEQEEEEEDRIQLQSNVVQSPTRTSLSNISKPNSLRNVMDAVQSHFKDKQATKIQAAYRGHATRLRLADHSTVDDDTVVYPLTLPSLSPRRSPLRHQYQNMDESPYPQQEYRQSLLQQQRAGRGRGSSSHHHRRRHRRDASEITMSDFETSIFDDNDSFSSMGSHLSLSPITNMRRNNEDQHASSSRWDGSGKGPGWFNNSALTEATAAPTDHSLSQVQQSSLSSIFSTDTTSMDVPAKMPFRKTTPPRSNLSPIERHSEASSVLEGTATEASRGASSPLSPPSPPVAKRMTAEEVSTLPNIQIPNMPSRASVHSAEADAEVAMATSERSTLDSSNEPFNLSVSSLPHLRRRKMSVDEWETTNQTLHLSFTSDSLDSPNDPPVTPLLRRTMYQGHPDILQTVFSTSNQSSSGTTVGDIDQSNAPDIARDQNTQNDEGAI